ncbi:glycine oxidase ThiO [Phytoactinopolyspora sp. XMNu-373]|uniref:glycine oxidase n=1 Tax=Phytoactinopolyspora mesophila TaxID=2650750 RepID=A0A7K3MAC2_9ACTN|nr:glycine oxidase ThiO [Phytoactinopolyspora mesophila]
MNEGDAADVLVVGCGIIGASIAWQLACHGLRVRCVDPAPGSGATYAAAGMLAAVTETTFGEHHLMRLNVRSAALWPGFAAELEAETGRSPGLRRTGTLTVAFDGGDRQQLNRLRDLQHQWGLDAQTITPDEARRKEPSLGPRIAGAVWAPGDHQVNPRAVQKGLLAALSTRGVDIVHRRVVRLMTDNQHDDADAGTVTGVVDDSGQAHHGGLVVLAAGWNSRQLIPTAGFLPHAGRVQPEPPAPATRPVKGQVVRLDSSNEPAFRLTRVVRGFVQARQVYLVPRDDGEIIIGATSEEQPDDRVVTAGGVFSLLRDARALVPGIDELPITELTARARPGSPDNVPLIGESGVDGLILATGHYRNGILLAPLTAGAVTSRVLEGTFPDSVAAANPSRFTHTHDHEHSAV